MTNTQRDVGAGDPHPFAIDVEALDDGELLGVVAGYYHATLLTDAAARTWLQQRGLGSDELVEHFGLGLANRTLGLRLQDLRHGTQQRLRSRLQQLGVLRQSGHEHLRGCIVVPLRDDSGHVVDLYGRKIVSVQRIASLT